MRKKTDNIEEMQEVKEKRRKQAKENKELNKGVEIVSKAAKKEKKREIKQRKLQEKERGKENNSGLWQKIKYILVLLLIVVIILLFKYRHIIGITFSKEITEQDAIIIEMTMSDNKVYEYQNEILVYSKGKLMTYSKYGKKTWEYTFDETFIPEIVTSGKYIQVVNKDSAYIYTFDNKYESSRKKIDGTIKRTSINEKGQSVVHYSKEGIKSNIMIFDKKGREQYKITLKEENIAKIELSNNGKYLLLYEIDTQGISANSIVKVVELKTSEKVKTALEINNDIIYDLILDNSKVYMLTSNNVYSYNIQAGSLREYNISDKNILNIALDETGIAYIHKELSDDNNKVTILNNMYDNIGEYKFNGTVKTFEYCNSLAYVISNKEMNIYNRWGIHVKKFTSDSIITNIVIFNNRYCNFYRI